MTQLDLLDERRHVKVYDGESIPDKELIEKILWRAWKVTPSKNNFMPYQQMILFLFNFLNNVINYYYIYHYNQNSYYFIS